MTLLVAQPPVRGARVIDGDRTAQARMATAWLIAAMAAASLLSLSVGASGVGLRRLLAASGPDTLSASEHLVIFNIRLPRLAMGLSVGAALAVSGAVMQGLFRNPLADPGLIGVSAGAGLGAITAIVLGGALPAAALAAVGTHLVPLAGFAGGWIATMLLYRIASHAGRTSVATMLLGGIAMSALAGAASGVLIYMADDAQLRDLTFWGMGSLSGATWTRLAVAAPLLLASFAAVPFLGRGLNGLALGEAAALHMGLPVQRIKLVAILTVAGATGAAVALSGGIGFVGIVVPHLLRLAVGPDHRHLLLNAGLLGATLLVLADVASRMIVAPAELPIGIVTALVGGPVFMAILLRQRDGLAL